MEDTREPRALAEIDRDFHLIYYQRTGNEVLVEMLEQVTNDLMRIERHAWGHDDIWATACDEHRQLMAAFERGDGKAAAAAAMENWRRSWDRIDKLLRSSGTWDRGAAVRSASAAHPRRDNLGQHPPVRELSSSLGLAARVKDAGQETLGRRHDIGQVVAAAGHDLVLRADPGRRQRPGAPRAVVRD